MCLVFLCLKGVSLPIFPTDYTTTTTNPTNWDTTTLNATNWESDDPDGDTYAWESGDIYIWEDATTYVFE